MPTITVKNIRAELYEKLKRVAAINHRSLNSEIIAWLERAVCSQQVDPDRLLAQARRLRAETPAHPITDRQSIHAKRAGRS
ncbi:MAG: Arc family DNA-binding protein [Sedimentisphaerales bacterium]|nr:Arc family DNA-binding protein [Sedimentisphaerales bacterium]